MWGRQIALGSYPTLSYLGCKFKVNCAGDIVGPDRHAPAAEKNIAERHRLSTGGVLKRHASSFFGKDRQPYGKAVTKPKKADSSPLYSTFHVEQLEMSASSDDFLRSARFASLVEELLIQHHVPGLAAATVQGQQVTSAGYGKACLEQSTPCTADTLFDIASSAKSLTAAAVGLLIDDNESYPDVQWDATMSSLLPDDFVMSEAEYTKGVTVEDILSHRSGMAAYNGTQHSPYLMEIAEFEMQSRQFIHESSGSQTR
jgi:hypothetical protein